MFSTARAAVNSAGLGLLLAGVLLMPVPGAAGVLDASWTAPTTNADGSPLTDLASYRVYYGTSNPPCPGSSFFEVASPTPEPPSNQTVFSRLRGLSTDTLYYVSITAVDTSGAESPCSTPMPSAVAQVGFTVSPTGTVNFGSVDLGSFVDQTFTVQSTRSEGVLGAVSTSAPFSIVSGNPFSLVGVGATQTVTMRFRPTTSATVTANVNLTADGDTISKIVAGTGTTPVDTTPPTVAMTSPTPNPTYTTSASSLTLGGTALDDVGVTQVTWANSRGGSGAATGTTSWTASGIALQPGVNLLTITARDAAGNGGAASLTVTMSDTTPPTVAVTAPISGATVAGTVTVAAGTTDNVGVVGVQFKLDGANLGAEDTTAPFTVSWNTTSAANGAHTVTAVARDAAGNSAPSGGVTVTVLNVLGTRAPYKGTPFAVPGLIEAEDFDNGGEGVAYHDLIAGNLGGQYRLNVDVDIVSPSAGMYVVNNFETGEWLSYTINVTQSGAYRIEALVSSEYTTSSWHAEIDGVNVTGSVLVPSTGWWGTFQWVGVDGVSMTGGQHILKIVADQQYFNLDSIRTVLSADITPPTVAMSAPPSGAVMFGTAVTLTADASDGVGVVGVQFQVDGVNLGAEWTMPPYSTSWDTTTASNGAHILTAVARDAAGNATTSAERLVTVANDLIPPVISALTVSGITASEATISWMTNELSDTQVRYGPTTAYGSVTPRKTALVTVHTQTLSGLAGSTVYHYRVRSRDALGNLATSADFTFTTLDRTPPIVSITSPASGATVAGTVTVAATATDTVGVVGVQFQLDGINLGPELTAAPYAVSWDTTTVASGAHTLTAVARDAAGNATAATPVSVTVEPMMVYRTASPITVDGGLDEWNGAMAVPFSGRSNSAIAYLLWDATNLYVAFRVNDTQLNAVQTARDVAALWADDTIEIYIDTRNNQASTMQPDDYHLLVNLNNVQADFRGTGGDEERSWNGVWESAVRLQGTLNDNADTDTGYTVEVAIPWAQIGLTPVSGMTLGIDLTVDDSRPTGFDYFDWAGIAPNYYAQPVLWKRAKLVDTPPQ